MYNMLLPTKTIKQGDTKLQTMRIKVFTKQQKQKGTSPSCHLVTLLTTNRIDQFNEAGISSL